MFSCTSLENEIGSDYANNKVEGGLAADITTNKKHSHAISSENIHFKILVPSMAAGAVIGKKGEAIAKIQKETGAKVKMSKSNDFYPGTVERVCLILGSMESVLQMFDYIVDRILDKPEVSSDPSATPVSQPQSQSPIDLASSTKDLDNPTSSNTQLIGRLQSTDTNLARFPMDRQKQVKVLVPNSTAGLIIGKGGQYIREIKETSGAYVQISQKSNDSNLSLPERCVIIAGERDSNRIAVRMILQKIAEDPQSSFCPQISYADCVGPLPSAYPTGSPFAVVVTSSGNVSGGTGPSVAVTSSSVGTAPGQPVPTWSKDAIFGQPTRRPPLSLETRQRIRHWLQIEGYSEKAIMEILNALQILSQYGLLNDQALFVSTGHGEWKLSITNGLQDTMGPSMQTSSPVHQNLLAPSSSSGGFYPPTASVHGTLLASPIGYETSGSHEYAFDRSASYFQQPAYPNPSSPFPTANTSLMQPLMVYGSGGGLGGGMNTPLSSCFSPNSSFNLPHSLAMAPLDSSHSNFTMFPSTTVHNWSGTGSTAPPGHHQEGVASYLTSGTLNPMTCGAEVVSGLPAPGYALSSFPLSPLTGGGTETGVVGPAGDVGLLLPQVQQAK